MMRNWWKFYCGLSAVASIAMAATTALAGDLGLVVNGDMETESRFAPHGTPGVDHPEWLPGWMASQRKTRRGAARSAARCP